METKKVYQAINEVATELAQMGIAKNSKNQMQGFNFRGIDAVYNALAPLLAKHKLAILPRCTERICVERTNAKGTALFYVTIKADFDFVGIDGSIHTVSTYGEAMDSGDKATNKAMSAAYKYAAFQAFCIPTEETAIDADSETHEVVKPAPKKEFSESAYEDSILAIEEAGSIAAIKAILKYAVDSGASKDQLAQLQSKATERKTILQGV
jgi:hypothetical protein